MGSRLFWGVRNCGSSVVLRDLEGQSAYILGGRK